MNHKILFAFLSMALLLAVYAQDAPVPEASSPASLQGATYRANLQRTGVHQTPGLAKGTKIKWSVPTGGPVRSSPVVVGGTLFVGSQDGHIYAIDTANGTVRWKLDTKGQVNGSATVLKDTLYMASESGTFYAIDTANGEVRWEHKEKGCASASSFAVLNGVALVGAAKTGMKKVNMSGASLLALDAQKGKKLWKAAGLQGIAAPAISGDQIICSNVSVSFGKKGKKVWSVKGGHQARTYNSTAVANGHAYVMFTMRGAIDCVDLKKGRSRWRVATNPKNLELEMNSGGLFKHISFTDLAVTDKRVFIGSQDGCLYAFDAKDGKRQWAFATKAPILTSSPSVAGSLVYFGSNDNHLYAVDFQGQEAWKMKLGGAINSSPWPGDSVVYVGCDDGKIYAIE